MTDLMELASRVEAGEGPDRELDSDIARWLMRHLNWHSADCLGRYTASIDDAMTLVPEGWTYIQIEQCARDLPGQHCRASVERLVEEGDEREAGYAATPALALTAAALRARAHQGAAHADQ